MLTQQPVKHLHVSTPAELAGVAELARANLRSRPPSFDLDAGLHAIRFPAENPKLLKEANDLLDKIMLDLPTTRREFQSEVVGAFPNVGAYAAGDPECMWLPYAAEDSHQPIKIWVQVSASAGIVYSADGALQLTKRGVTLMALIIALSERRQVSLTCYHACAGISRDGGIVSWDVPTAPLVIPQVLTSLADPNVVRDVAYFANDYVNGRHVGQWLHGHNPTRPDYDVMRQDLGASSDDIIVAGMHVSDPLITNPIKWINEKLADALKERND